MKNGPTQITRKQDLQALYLEMAENGDPSYRELAWEADRRGLWEEDWKATQWLPAAINECRDSVTRPGPAQLPLGLLVEPTDPKGSGVRARQKCSREVRDRNLRHRSRALCHDYEPIRRLHDETAAIHGEAQPIPVLGMGVSGPRSDGSVVVMPIQLDFVNDLFPEE